MNYQSYLIAKDVASGINDTANLNRFFQALVNSPIPEREQMDLMNEASNTGTKSRVRYEIKYQTSESTYFADFEHSKETLLELLRMHNNGVKVLHVKEITNYATFDLTSSMDYMYTPSEEAK